MQLSSIITENSQQRAEQIKAAESAAKMSSELSHKSAALASVQSQLTQAEESVQLMVDQLAGLEATVELQDGNISALLQELHGAAAAWVCNAASYTTHGCACIHSIMRNVLAIVAATEQQSRRV